MVSVCSSVYEMSVPSKYGNNPAPIKQGSYRTGKTGKMKSVREMFFKMALSMIFGQLSLICCWFSIKCCRLSMIFYQMSRIYFMYFTWLLWWDVYTLYLMYSTKFVNGKVEQWSQTLVILIVWWFFYSMYKYLMFMLVCECVEVVNCYSIVSIIVFLSIYTRFPMTLNYMCVLISHFHVLSWLSMW